MFEIMWGANAAQNTIYTVWSCMLVKDTVVTFLFSSE